jgi:sulfoxide reductase catalytic subunit YedY
MLIKNKKSWELPENQVTPEKFYLNRRQIMKTMGLGAAAAVLSPALKIGEAKALPNFNIVSKTNTAPDEKLNSYEDITTYNNYYEFGTGKGDPVKNAHQLTTEPWTVKVDGFAENKGTFDIEDLIDFNNLEERIYRLRCVEAWSMVIPWVGVPLSSIIEKLKPTSDAKYVRFETVARPNEMPGLRSRVLNWPYKEGLRLDEAMTPLSFMAVGLYGKPLPNQNGAPMRLVVPWKYGFKSIKSIARISFEPTRPLTSWEEQSSREYGFYSNVNPTVDHPRWSQARERRIGEFFKRETLMFNGYEEEVAHLYKDMNLNVFF